MHRITKSFYGTESRAGIWQYLCHRFEWVRCFCSTSWCSKMLFRQTINAICSIDSPKTCRKWRIGVKWMLMPLSKRVKDVRLNAEQFQGFRKESYTVRTIVWCVDHYTRHFLFICIHFSSSFSSLGECSFYYYQLVLILLSLIILTPFIEIPYKLSININVFIVIYFAMFFHCIVPVLFTVFCIDFGTSVFFFFFLKIIK